MTTVAATSVDPLDPAKIGAHGASLLQRDQWSCEQLAEYQRERLRALIRHAVRHSPYYREVLGSGAEGAELAELPTLTKRVLMEQFDAVVTDPCLRLANIEPFLGHADAGALYLGEYRVFSTSGTSGVPGLFVYSQAEFAHWVGVFIRSFARLGMTPATRIVGVGAPSALHLSQQVIAAMQAGRSGAPRISVTTPLREMIPALEAYQPEVVGGYPSVIALLAEEQLRGRLAIAPRVVLTTSEVLTDDAAWRIEAAWTKPVQGYFSTEVGVIASGSLDHVGMHVSEEAIVEVVDDANRPAPPGTLGARVLLTNLVNLSQPLIRYELSDAVLLETGPDPVAGRSTGSGVSTAGATTCCGCPARAAGSSPSTRTGCARRSSGCWTSCSTRSSTGTTACSSGSSRAARLAVTSRRRCAARSESALSDAGAAAPVRVELVPAIEREPGHAAKVKLVVSEVPPPA